MLYRAWGSSWLVCTLVTSLSGLLACQAAVQDDHAQQFCAPGHVTGDQAADPFDMCACAPAGRSECVVGLRASQSWMCGSDGHWSEVPDGACINATSPCPTPMASLETCFGKYNSCVLRFDGSVCGYR